MASYRIEWKQWAQKELKKLGKGVVSRILKAVEDLAEKPHPRGGRKLMGTDYTYRIRVGEYRVVYSLHETALIIEVVRVGHRKEVFRKLT
ncbi:MAG: type II toxin-antitoxin system RelE family toxin [Actinomycetota bacterium]